MEIKSLQERIINPELLDIAIADISSSIKGLLQVRIEEADESVEAITDLYRGLAKLGVTGDDFKELLHNEVLSNLFISPIEKLYFEALEVKSND